MTVSMAPVSTAPRLATWWILLSLCFLTASQKPSNDTLPLNAPSYSLDTDTSQNGMSAPFKLFSLSTTATFRPVCSQCHAHDRSLTVLQQDDLTADIILITTADIVRSLQRVELAYISCDPSAYTGSGVGDIVSIARSTSKAIILYSNTSDHCTYNDTSDGPKNRLTFTMVNVDMAILLEKQLGKDNGRGHGTIRVNDMSNGSSTPSNTSNGYDGRSPTTAVAMIILYSITGIITALFLCIIVVGAIRAHRHPERYGPRNMLGRPRVSICSPPTITTILFLGWNVQG